MDIELDILWLNEEQQGMQDAGLQVDFEECDIKKHTFYNISYIRPSSVKGYTQISSDGDFLITNIEYNELRDRIKNNINFTLN